MSTILKDVPLIDFNTFGINSVASNFIKVINNQELMDAVLWSHTNSIAPLILGGGANILFTSETVPFVIKNNILGKKIIAENKEEVVVKVGAGEMWHNVVLFCVKSGWGGIENLSLIPGTIGAAPMQNIGAYGVELKEVFVSLEALNLDTLKIEPFGGVDCEFGYRESVFKKALKGKYFITNVTLKLRKNSEPNISYGAIREILDRRGISIPSIRDVSNAVIEIRQSKLPDPNNIGNAGSFFKNPILSREHVKKLKTDYPNVPIYEQDDGSVKVPAGWLIEQCGWKGKRFGAIGVHDKQALVLVNYGGGTGLEIKSLAAEIQDSVNKKFRIEILPEVNFV